MLPEMLSIDPLQTSTADLHQYLLGAVAPRPICFASTVGEDGNPNLAPYSFFNVFSSNPPTAIFSSNRTIAANGTKDTLGNVHATKEVVINVVSYEMVRQMAVASIAFPPEISEFEKAGFTPIKSDLVKPFRVKESPAQLECKVKDIISLGDGPGAGNLIVCEVLRMHVAKSVLDEDQKIDPQKIDLVGRMGRAFYCRASGDAVFKVFQPVNVLSIGVDQLPKTVKFSTILSGNDLGQLGGLARFSTKEEITEAHSLEDVQHVRATFSNNPEAAKNALHQLAKNRIAAGKIQEALAILS